MKKIKQKLKWINEEYKHFKSYDVEINKLNELKHKRLENIIILLKQTDFLKQIKEIEGVKSAHLNIWNDIENPNWEELEIVIHTQRKSSEFSDYKDYIRYDSEIRSKIYLLLDDMPDLNEFIMVYTER